MLNYSYKYTYNYMIMSTYSNSCKYTFSKLWIVIRIPLTTCKMKSISTIITICLNIITI